MMAMNAITLIADLRRRIDNLLRLGTVEAVRAGECRVKSGELLTDWRPYLTQRAGTARSSWRPTKGEQVLLLSLSGDVTNAYVLPALYCDALPEPDDHPTRHRTVYPDGAVIEYDPEVGALTAKGINTARVQASEKVTIDTPNADFTGNVSVAQKLTVNQGVSVKGALDHQGQMTNQGGVSIDGIAFGTHKHGGVDTGNGTSGGPQ